MSAVTALHAAAPIQPAARPVATPTPPSSAPRPAYVVSIADLAAQQLAVTAKPPATSGNAKPVERTVTGVDTSA